MAISTYRENLIQTVLDNSYGNTWEEAVNEWEITDCVEDRSRKESCICGKEELKYLYEIHNVVHLTTLIISKKPGNTGISRDIRTEFTTDLLLSD